MSQAEIATTDNNNCNMVGLLGILIQVGLGVLSFSVLLIKRFRESPPRPWKIWMFDTSKQGVSQMLAHFINLTISIALTYRDSSSDECLWYFTTNILDNTIGVLICVFCLVLIEKRLVKKGKTQYISGNYYSYQRVFVNIEVINKPNDQSHKSEPSEKATTGEGKEVRSEGQREASVEINQDHKQELVQEKDVEVDKVSDVQFQSQQSSHNEVVQKIHINYKAWLVQLLIWNSIVVVGKGILFGFQFGIEDTLKNLTITLMGWIEEYEVLQLVVVIVIVPVIMNGLAFWVQDNFLKKQETQLEGEIQLVNEHSSQKQQQKYQIM